MVIGDVGEARREERLEDRAVDLRSGELRVAGDRERAVDTVPGSVTEVVIGLDPDEPGQDVVERPAGVPARGPRVEVRRSPTEREPRLPAGSAHEATAAQGPDGAALVRLRLIAPIVTGREVPAVVERVVQVPAGIRPGFDQQDGSAGSGQPSRDDAASGTRADDDDLGSGGAGHRDADTIRPGRRVPATASVVGPELAPGLSTSHRTGARAPGWSCRRDQPAGG